MSLMMGQSVSIATVKEGIVPREFLRSRAWAESALDQSGQSHILESSKRGAEADKAPQLIWRQRFREP